MFVPAYMAIDGALVQFWRAQKGRMMNSKSDLTNQIFNDTYTGAIDPMELFELWFSEAVETEINDPNAMTLASVDAQGLPDARIVLMNGRDDQGMMFFGNLESAKGLQLLGQSKAALLFHWKSSRRQVRLRGPIEQVSDAVADTYFASRPRGSQIGAHASQQSRPLTSRDTLASRVKELELEFGEGEIARPAYWSGFRLLPQQWEFWQDGEFRLHNRVRFETDGDGWTRQRLNP